MLLIAQPKSASTSLGRTLAYLLEIKYKNGIGYQAENNSKCRYFTEIQKYHTTKLVCDNEYFKRWMLDDKIIMKDHILPLDSHIKFIKKYKKPVIILLRNPEHSLDCYLRLYEMYKNNELNEDVAKELHVKKLESIDFDKFAEDLRNYNKGWKNSNIGNAIYIDFDNLVMKPKKTLGNIIRFLKRKPKNKITELFKAHGNGGYQTFTGVGLERLKNESSS